MTRRKLIFFTGAHPAENPRPTWLAYHFAEVAAGAGLEAEVRLAGDAVRVAQPGGAPPTPAEGHLRHLRRSLEHQVHAPTFSRRSPPSDASPRAVILELVKPEATVELLDASRRARPPLVEPVPIAEPTP
ncbi:MAG TPA: hypothetical protein VGV63_01965 [Acidimicrobiales bacterium]|nr:hypothetical protein [Acidimicrobiales bacterium]